PEVPSPSRPGRRLTGSPIASRPVGGDAPMVGGEGQRPDERSRAAVGAGAPGVRARPGLRLELGTGRAAPPEPALDRRLPDRLRWPVAGRGAPARLQEPR